MIVAGTGLIGHRHLAHIDAHPALTLAGIIDPDPNRRTHDSAPGFADIDAVDVPCDGLVIATPTETHAPLAIAAMERGWDVLVEKPLAETRDAAQRIIDAAERTGRKVLVGHHRRHHPRVEALQKLIAEGELGQPVGASLMWYMRKPDEYFDIGWRAGMNGAPVKQNLIHDVDMLCWLFGDVDEVVGIGGNPVRGAARTEHGGAVLRFASGVIVSIAFADTTPTPWGFEAGTGESPAIPHTKQDSLRIACTGGAVEFPSLTVWSGAASWNEAPQARQLDVSEAVPLVRQLEHFADVIAGRASPRVSARDGLRALDVTLKIEAATLPKGVSI
nr:Gfo/Idh/MocA family oxidoreductase [Shimia biformata]